MQVSTEELPSGFNIDVDIDIPEADLDQRIDYLRDFLSKMKQNLTYNDKTKSCRIDVVDVVKLIEIVEDMIK